ncbi:MAG: hypothetical protein ACOYN2_01340 [Patescibacteria group bacterium]
MRKYLSRFLLGVLLLQSLSFVAFADVNQSDAETNRLAEKNAQLKAATDSAAKPVDSNTPTTSARPQLSNSPDSLSSTNFTFDPNQISPASGGGYANGDKE